MSTRPKKQAKRSKVLRYTGSWGVVFRPSEGEPKKQLLEERRGGSRPPLAWLGPAEHHELHEGFGFNQEDELVPFSSCLICGEDWPCLQAGELVTHPGWNLGSHARFGPGQKGVHCEWPHVDWERPTGLVLGWGREVDPVGCFWLTQFGRKRRTGPLTWSDVATRVLDILRGPAQRAETSHRCLVSELPEGLGQLVRVDRMGAEIPWTESITSCEKGSSSS